MNTRLVEPTPFGPVAILWDGPDDDPVVVRILIAKPGLSAAGQASRLFPDSPDSSCRRIERLAAGIGRFLCGEAVDFSLSLARLSLCSGFRQRVLRAEHHVPRGSVTSYRLIAERLGLPGGARAVGGALAGNPFPIIVPCHRAVRSDGRLGGYQGGLAMKRALLEMEGVRFDAAGRVASGHFRRMSLRPATRGRPQLLILRPPAPRR